MSTQLWHIILAAILCATRPSVTVSAQSPSPAGPQVTTTQPASGGTDVSLDVKEIVVTFDQDMDRGSFSFIGGGATFPKVRGQPSWRNARECVLPVELSAGRQYVIGVNSAQRANFRSAGGVPATPFTLRFTTRSGGGAPAGARPAAGNAEAVRRLREAIEQRYSHRETRAADWPALWRRFEPRLIAAKSARDFAVIAGEMLAATADPHIWLEADGELVPAFRRSVTPNVAPALLPRLIEKWTPHNKVVATGWAAPRVGYIAIHSWERKHGRDAFEPAFKALEEFRNAPAVIIDVRLNSGGDEQIAREFAGCFVERRALYARHINVDPSSQTGFSAPVERWLEPSAKAPRYTGKVAVLMGPANMSSTESFLRMMKQAPRVTLIGQRSYGSSGNPKPHALGNGVTVFLPSWKEFEPDGAVIEGKGIAPDIGVPLSSDTTPTRDATLERAVEHLRDARKPSTPGDRR